MSSLRTQLQRRRALDVPLVMGVVNVTPDSFSDGGVYYDQKRACEHIDALLDQGADLIDIGGESTRPGSAPVPPDEQVRRIVPAIQHAVARGTTVSVDTTQALVARAALEQGATVVNDVSCLRDGDALAKVAAEHSAWLIIMHAREPMETMRGFSSYPDNAYTDVVHDVVAEWHVARARAEQAGLASENILFDPGLGFNKNANHSNALLERLDEMTRLPWPVVVGPSRKSFLTKDVPSNPQQRIGGTIAACLACALRGAAIVRVHDVLEVRQAFAVARALGLLKHPAASARGDDV